MKAPISFKGEIGRWAYATITLPTFLSQHLIALLLTHATGAVLREPWWFWLHPMRAVSFEIVGSAPLLLLMMALTVLADAILASLAFRRARQADQPGWIAALVVMPVAQIAVITWLCLCPARPSTEERKQLGPGVLTAQEGAIGLLFGVALSVATVAFSTLVLRLYGYGLFVLSPFVIGMATGYVVNRRTEITAGASTGAVLFSLLLGGLALLSFAFEGAICLILAFPLIGVMGALGGLLGRALAGVGHPRKGSTLASIALVVPMTLAGERLAPPQVSFESVESVDVSADPNAVWNSIVHMGPIPGAPAAPFRWGLAYPVRGQIFGTGVGAVRLGVFSTGIAYERVTVWEPDRRLWFDVLSDPPAMRELSPYAKVNAPHVRGYFRTLDAHFTIQPLANGKTKLSLATRHEIDLEPALYWLPIAEWAIHANKVRVLAHFQHQAEGAIRTALPPA